VSLYRLAYEESKRTLDDQSSELSEVRQRGVAFVAFVGASTAFLVGTSLASPVRDLIFYGIAGLATVLSLATLVLVVTLLSPWQSWDYRLSSEVLVSRWIESDVPAPDEAQFLRALALRYDQMFRDNERKLAVIRRVYVAEILTGTLQLIVWVLLAWVRA
jgi:hypothetical protein